MSPAKAKDEVEFSCPECGEQDDIHISQYDTGRCQETGYNDAGVWAKCRCGFEGDVEGNFLRVRR